MKVLIVGGTGPTGPSIIGELLDRSHDVTVLHRGQHEPDDGVITQLEHIHADPHFAESLTDALGDRTFDVVVATYGRIRIVAQVMEGRCGHFIGIGGNPAHPGMLDRNVPHPSGMQILAAESDPTVLDIATAADAERNPRLAFAMKVARTEQSVLDAHARGAYIGTYIRYPLVYGWRTWLQFERGIVRRLLDGRTRIVLPDGGLGILTRCADVNAAHAVVLAVDHPDAAGGNVFHCGDDEQYSLHQWTELIMDALDIHADIVGVPIGLARSTWDMLPSGAIGTPHSLVNLDKTRSQLGYRDVIAAKDALDDIVTRLATDASIAAVTYDRETEDATLGAYDRMGSQLAAELGWEEWDDNAYFSTWHPYDHPDNPGDTNKYGGLQPPAWLSNDEADGGAQHQGGQNQ